jgi:hypothetical protein
MPAGSRRASQSASGAGSWTVIGSNNSPNCLGVGPFSSQRRISASRADGTRDGRHPGGSGSDRPEIRERICFTSDSRHQARPGRSRSRTASVVASPPRASACNNWSSRGGFARRSSSGTSRERAWTISSVDAVSLTRASGSLTPTIFAVCRATARITRASRPSGGSFRNPAMSRRRSSMPSCSDRNHRNGRDPLDGGWTRAHSRPASRSARRSRHHRGWSARTDQLPRRSGQAATAHRSPTSATGRRSGSHRSWVNRRMVVRAPASKPFQLSTTRYRATPAPATSHSTTPMKGASRTSSSKV